MVEIEEKQMRCNFWGCVLRCDDENITTMKQTTQKQAREILKKILFSSSFVFFFYCTIKKISFNILST